MLPPGPDWLNQGLRQPGQLEGETCVPQGKDFQYQKQPDWQKATDTAMPFSPQVFCTAFGSNSDLS